MKVVTLTLTLTEAEELDYALLLACNECTKRGWEGRAFTLDIIRDRLSWKVEKTNEAQEPKH